MANDARSSGPRTLASSLCAALFFTSVLVGACSGGHRSGVGGAGAGGSSTLTIAGSDTMVILAQRFAEAYMRAHPGTTIQVSGGGSGTGIAALVNGTTTIADASRAMKDEEKARVRTQRHADAHETRVALDAVAVYVHASNPLPQLTIASSRRTARGRIGFIVGLPRVNWVGGDWMG